MEDPLVSADARCIERRGPCPSPWVRTPVSATLRGMAPKIPLLAPLLRSGLLDADLAALVWALADGGLPLHVAAHDPADAARLAAGLEDLVKPVTVLAGGSLEAVLDTWTDEPARLGVVVIVGEERVAAAHWLRPPIRDGAGHVRAQGPAVLAVWDARTRRFEHFAWGVIPDLAVAIGRKAGDLEFDVESRRSSIAEVVILGA